MPPAAPKVDALVARHAEIQTELQDLWRRNNENSNYGVVPVPLVPPVAPKRRIGEAISLVDLPPVAEKTDLHWDFLCKEMQWLATDFMAERKRHTTQRRRVAHSVIQHFSRQSARAQTALVQAQAKRRKVASKLSRDVKGWWTKLEKVITYRQKILYDEGQTQAMNKKLVTLVKQTERYTESLAQSTETGVSPNGHRTNQLTIEQALAATTRRRRVRDYARLAKQQDEHLSATSEDDEASMIYGVSLLDDNGASAEDSSYAPSSDGTDDETTLREAEQAEHFRTGDTTASSSFTANPVELLKLQQEQNMDIDEVLERLQQEADDEHAVTTTVDRPRRVQFAADPGADADDDGDASDVEDYQDDENDEEFQPSQPAIDDETTLAAEEALPQEMTPSQELKMLRDEQELSLEDLRKRYAVALGGERLGEVDKEGEETMDDQVLGDDGLADDEDFEPIKGGDVDDETTIEAEEQLGRDMSYEDELALLQKEGEMSIEELQAMYSGLQNADNDDKEENDMDLDQDKPEDSEFQQKSLSGELLGVSQGEEGDHDEYIPRVGADVDDETTIEKEEQLGREMSYEEELAVLQKEGEMSIEELRAMYGGTENQVGSYADPGSFVSRSDAGFTVNENEDDTAGGRNLRRRRKRSVIRSPEENDSEASKSSQKKLRTEHSEASDTEAALAALEKSAESARTTLASRPFLLSEWVKLREYQQIGLNWLVSLHGRRLNGILADEMGLGKTLQTITLLAYLAAYKGIWGPHLVVVPTSVILNWETELKRFCPSFKVLCYYGSAKRRKELRMGWTKTNVYHVVITSYQLAVQDAFAFKRKRWYYLILDEAQNIKNFQSQRWQTLIGFNSQRRLLLSGTPLQNTLMELWSLLHFLMPYIFRSRKEFAHWFANPMSSMIEGNSRQNNDVVQRLHGILRPFVLRRLKKDVETQMPGKFEHIVKVPLSKRQMYLYEEFMARSSTRQALKSGSSGNFMAMMNVLMQLRKVCNHPDLFEPRAIITPFVLDPIPVQCPSKVFLSTRVFDKVSVQLLNPLWCGSTGEPGMRTALSHDIVEHTHLSRICEDLVAIGSPTDSTGEPPVDGDDALRVLLRKIQLQREQTRRQTTAFQGSVNTRRCKADTFPYNQTVQQLLRVPGRFKDRSDLGVLNTPSDLLALRRTQQHVAEDVDQLVKKFVFCVPKAGVREEVADSPKKVDGSYQALLSPLEEYLKPFQSASARLSSFFPDKKLIQFDSGKLQTLAELLRVLKKGGHRTLIFTQMSKMLDILEAFLNLNGHTYLRLDGSTGVDRRQRLMDRFNSDPKVFCFILSTRSGGLGINLTGADTVIFFDTDWNPAMDAQAQDRAHRIGQTREVHVYRLVTEQTIEENILMKARQKRNLDILVMDKGRFDSSHLFGSGDAARMATPDSAPADVYTKTGLQSILLGVSTDKMQNNEKAPSTEEDIDKDMTVEQMESAMTELEDKDDVNALRGAQKEAAEELKEFDESIEIKDGDGGDGNIRKDTSEPSEKDERAEQEALEREFAAWQTEVGMDNDAIEASLTPLEKYGLHIREALDPFYSLYAVLEYNRKLDEKEEANNDIDIEEIEAEKAADERNAILDGDLLVTEAHPEDLVRQRKMFQRERGRKKANAKRRQMTGENWEVRIDQQHNAPFWYNVDTGEARWDKPKVLVELELLSQASAVGWEMLPPLVQVMSFLAPYQRHSASLVCKQWSKAASDISFIRHVYPVEMGAATRSNIHPNHYRSFAECVQQTSPGDTVEFSDGHYWVNEDLTVDIPLRLVGDEHRPSNVIIEMNNGCCITWKGTGGWIEGITFRRPQIASAKPVSQPILRVESQGKLHMHQSAINNEGSSHDVSIEVMPGGYLKLDQVAVQAGRARRLAESAILERIST